MWMCFSRAFRIKIRRWCENSILSIFILSKLTYTHQAHSGSVKNLHFHFGFFVVIDVVACRWNILCDYRTINCKAAWIINKCQQGIALDFISFGILFTLDRISSRDTLSLNEYKHYSFSSHFFSPSISRILQWKLYLHQTCANVGFPRRSWIFKISIFLLDQSFLLYCFYYRFFSLAFVSTTRVCDFTDFLSFVSSAFSHHLFFVASECESFSFALPHTPHARVMPFIICRQSTIQIFKGNDVGRIMSE